MCDEFDEDVDINRAHKYGVIAFVPRAKKYVFDGVSGNVGGEDVVGNDCSNPSSGVDNDESGSIRPLFLFFTR